MQTKTFEYAERKYQIERDDKPGSFWQLYRVNGDGSRTHLDSDRYQNDLRERVRTGKYISF